MEQQKITYKLIKDLDGVERKVFRSDGWTIPFDEGNADYQLYKLWLEEGNTPEPAEEIKPDYRAQRATEYPSIGDQLDALFHAGMMPLELTIQIQAIKAKYPKV
jgi:hypothetical protein